MSSMFKVFEFHCSDSSSLSTRSKLLLLIIDPFNHYRSHIWQTVKGLYFKPYFIPMLSTDAGRKQVLKRFTHYEYKRINLNEKNRKMTEPLLNYYYHRENLHFYNMFVVRVKKMSLKKSDQGIKIPKSLQN